MLNDQQIFLVRQKDEEMEEPVIKDMYRAGVLAEVKQIEHKSGSSLRVMVYGKKRGILSAMHDLGEFWEAEISFPEEEKPELPDDITEEGMKEVLIHCLEE